MPLAVCLIWTELFINLLQKCYTLEKYVFGERRYELGCSAGVSKCCTHKTCVNALIVIFRTTRKLYMIVGVELYILQSIEIFIRKQTYNSLYGVLISYDLFILKSTKIKL